MSSLGFQLQSGVHKSGYNVEGPELSLRDLRDYAVKFIEATYPEHGWGNALADHLLLYRHDLRSINILQLITTSADVQDGTLVEVVITATPQQERLVVHPHTLFVHSYRAPAFCDFCGEMLFGLVKQGLKCQGCGHNYHKRCASKIPNNCSGHRQRRPSAIPLSPKNSLAGGGGAPLAASTPAAAAAAALLADGGGSGGGSARLPSPIVRPSPSTSQLNTPDIYVTADDDSVCSSSIGFLGAPNMGRKDRSSSWSGRPLWMEVADATRVKVPHTFQVHSYTKPTMCQHCKKLLKGLLRQGTQCRDCKYNCHKKCVQFVPKDCPGNVSHIPAFLLGGYDSDSQSARSVVASERRRSDPAAESGFGGSMEQLSRMSSMPLDSDTGQSPAESAVSSTDDLSVASTRRGRAMPSAPLSSTTTDDDDDSALNESANIPLMRIVMSKKHTKRPGGRVLREGWVVHFTDGNNMRKKHYWRLDTKCVTMYIDDSSNRYYKEVPLSDILDVRANDTEAYEERTFAFALRTAACTYYVATALGAAEEAAGAWDAAIKRALMPVTPQTSAAAQQAMAQLKVPLPGDTGQLGVRMQSEQEFSQHYQIFADDVLGSGQFGTVYAGTHRKTKKPVAVKVIDKSKFPSNKEAALRTEVEILQKVRHRGVVELEQMLETAERIFVVMEKMRGDMLEMILSSERGRLCERNTQFLVHQILVALRYLHSQNVVHCDLKPENILLASDDDFPLVKLCDFGFARIIGERGFRRSVVGTPAYLAPEVLRNKGFNRSLDMWSVGVIVYVSLSGTFPFNEDEDINDQIQNAEFMYPPTPWRDIRPDAVDFINALLQVKMAKRLTVHKALAHVWLQDYQLWSDLRCLERMVGERYVTHESDDARWAAYERARSIAPVYLPSAAVASAAKH